MIDSWSLGKGSSRHTAATVTKDGGRSVEDKRSPRLPRLVNHSETMTITENNKTLKGPVLFPPLLQQWQCVGVTSSRLLYAPLDERLFIDLARRVFMQAIRHPCYIYSFVAREGKAAVFGSLAACSVCVFVRVCVYSCALTRTETHALGLLRGCAHVSRLSYYVEGSWRPVHKTVYTLQSLFI